MSRNRNTPCCRKTAVLLVMGVFLLSGCKAQAQTDALLQEDFITDPAVEYQTATVEKGSFILETTDRPTILYTKKESLFWDTGSARFEEVFVRKNQKVKEGDILMSFKVEVSEAELAALRLRLQRAKEDLETGSAEREQAIAEAQEDARYLGYYQGKIAQLKIEKQQVEYEQFLYLTQREIAQLEQEIAEIEAKKENHVLRAPFDGIISDVVSWTLGGKVPVGQPLITIYSPDFFLLRCANNGELLYNMPVTVESNNSSETFTGRVVAASNILPSSLNSNYAMIRLDGNIAADTFGRIIKINAQTKVLEDVLIVDSSAIKKEGNKSYVYLLDGDVLRKRYVTVGAESSETAWIVAGLTEGMTVITELEG